MGELREFEVAQVIPNCEEDSGPSTVSINAERYEIDPQTEVLTFYKGDYRIASFRSWVSVVDVTDNDDS